MSDRVVGRAKAVLGVELRDPSWFRPIKGPVPVGTPSQRSVDIPQADAQVLLRSVVRRVADIPAGSSPLVVWASDTAAMGNSELLVHTDSITINCQNGLVTIGVRVDCDQLESLGRQGGASVTVPFAVGTAQAPAGLVMHTFDRLAGPAVVTELWSDAITAFAWESLVELTRSICAALGKDSAGRPLVPGAIASAPKFLLVQPMGRHDVSLRAVR